MLNILDYVEQVLKDSSGPLHYREITTRMLAAGWPTQGRTPWETINSRLAVDIKQRGAASRFVRTSPGVFTLNPDQNLLAYPPDPKPATAGRDRAGGLSFSDAAAQVLQASQSREPMHYQTITALAMDEGLLRSEGLTPAATMYSVILGEIRRHEARGEAPRFVAHGKGMVGLSAWVPRGLAAQIEEHNRRIREALLERVRQGSPKEFEELVGELLAALGFEEVEVTGRSGDGGIDVRGTLVVGEVVRIKMGVQAKRWGRANIQSPTVQQVRGSLGAHEQGLIITTSDFSTGAVNESNLPDRSPVALMNGEQLAALMAEHEIGVRRDRFDLFSLDEAQDPETD